ncbi:hypothetical protein BDSB_11490 [Burkholderia dolosa PC543]|nr:hypothetical protein BDSB_11490 [Burkholderia dolosa PC543]
MHRHDASALDTDTMRRLSRMHAPAATSNLCIMRKPAPHRAAPRHAGRSRR